MRHLNCLFTAGILNILYIVFPGGCYRFPTLPDNCTCNTSHGTYSLFHLRRTDGKPRFSESGFMLSPFKDYTYTYNPCVPYNLTSTKRSCTDVALCKYDTEGDPPVYSDIGEQRDVKCEISDGQISLIYPIHNKDIPIQESKVILKCNNNSQADSKFNVTNEDDMIFTLTSICGCPNRCPPIAPIPSFTPMSDRYSNLVLVILLPILLAFVVMAICLILLLRRLSVIHEAIVCRCCNCYEYREPGRDERVERVARETSSLIKNQADNRAIEHEDVLAKGKIREPVQVEDGDVEVDYKFRGKK